MTMIVYHVDWPDYDSMNVLNPTEPAAVVSNYGITGVPQSVFDGVVLANTVTQTNINTDYAVASPFTIRLIHQIASGKITVQMVIKKTATTTGTYAAKIAVIEKTVTYTSPAAGTNGETSFPNVFRKFLPDANGITLASMNVGDSVTIVRSWNYSHIKNIANLEAVGFIQNTSDKTIPQSAYSVAGTIPASADFMAISTNTCTGTINFTDQSYLATSWNWDFGDGGTSTLQNPSHTYTASGSFSVILKINSNASTITKSNYIIASLPAAPTTTGGTGSIGASVTLYAAGAGTLKWYTTQTGGNHIAKGTSYTTPPLSTTTNYYVEDVVGQAVQSVGMTAKTTNGGYYTSTARQGEIFDVYRPVTINSVTIYANSTGSKTIFLKNSSGTTIDSLVTSVNGTQSVNLNFHVPAGTGYILGVSAANNCWRETSGAAYPYSISNVMSITNSTAGSAYYYYCYNWQVQPDSCISPRAIVTADIATGINEKGAIVNYSLYPNPSTGEIILNIATQKNQDITFNVIDLSGKIVYSNQLNVNGELKKKFDFSYLSKGIYFMRIIADKEVFNEKIMIE